MDSNKPKIKICPIKQFNNILKQGNFYSIVAVISSSHEIPKLITELKHCVILKYDDINHEVPGKSFSAEDAQKAADFIKKYNGFNGTLFCCCDGGISRSSAIAAASCRSFGRDDMYIWENPNYSPNPYVYEKLCHALGIEVNSNELNYRIETSLKALDNAINSRR